MRTRRAQQSTQLALLDANVCSPWYEPLDSFPRRSDHPALETVPAVLARLTALQVGDSVPVEIYIADYDTGTIPPWMVQERILTGALVLTLIDANARPIEATEDRPELRVAIQVVAVPNRVLATTQYMIGGSIYGPRGQLHDLLQQVRVANKKRKDPLL